MLRLLVQELTVSTLSKGAAVWAEAIRPFLKSGREKCHRMSKCLFPALRESLVCAWEKYFDQSWGCRVMRRADFCHSVWILHGLPTRKGEHFDLRGKEKEGDH